MRNWMSQIVIGVIVTVVGTVIANAIISGKGGRDFFGGGTIPVRTARAGRYAVPQPTSLPNRDRFVPVALDRDTPVAARQWRREAREGGDDGRDDRRWKNRPENSTWGDYGPNDQLGRMNELTAGEGQAGHRRGEGGQDLLPLHAARLSRRQRAEPAPASAAAAPVDARRQAELALPHRVGEPRHDRRHQRRRRHHAPAVLDAVGHAGPRRRAVRCRRRRQGRARVLQRLSRRHRSGGAERRQGRRRRARHVRRGEGHVVGQRAGRREHGGEVPAGARRDDRPVRALRPQAACGRLRRPDAHHGGRRHQGGAGRLRAAAHGLRRGDLRGQQDARPGDAGDELHRPRRQRQAPAAVGDRDPSWWR